MSDAHSRLSRQEILAYLACYSLYLVLIVLALLGFVVWRGTIVALLATFMERSYAGRLIYIVGMLGLGIALFVLVMSAEPYMRHGVERHQLLRRFTRMAVPIVVVLVVGLLARLLAL